VDVVLAVVVVEETAAVAADNPPIKDATKQAAACALRDLTFTRRNARKVLQWIPPAKPKGSAGSRISLVLQSWHYVLSTTFTASLSHNKPGFVRTAALLPFISASLFAPPDVTLETQS
jgi:hypothetical protein